MARHKPGDPRNETPDERLALGAAGGRTRRARRNALRRKRDRQRRRVEEPGAAGHSPWHEDAADQLASSLLSLSVDLPMPKTVRSGHWVWAGSPPTTWTPRRLTPDGETVLSAYDDWRRDYPRSLPRQTDLAWRLGWTTVAIRSVIDDLIVGGWLCVAPRDVDGVDRGERFVLTIEGAAWPRLTAFLALATDLAHLELPDCGDGDDAEAIEHLHARARGLIHECLLLSRRVTACAQQRMLRVLDGESLGPPRARARSDASDDDAAGSPPAEDAAS